MSTKIPNIAAPHAITGAKENALWTPDTQDGSYRNPIIYADYSDPDVIRHGEDFYLIASSFNCTPGIPILHSRDLVNWQIINHAVKNLPHPRYEVVQPGCGIWAPSLRYHAEKFWIFFPMPDEGLYVTTATDPTGEWSPPHLLQEGKGLIDPCPLWDDDGQAYLVHAYAHSRSGIKHCLRVCPMAPDGSRLLGPGKIVYNNPSKHPTLEGPKFHERNGWYYILAPAGGVATGWQTVMRSRSIYGPYEDRTVLAQGTTCVNGPHQGGLVDTPEGEWWFVHFQDAGVYGRIVHLQPVEWKDDWPLVGEPTTHSPTGQPVSTHSLPRTRGSGPSVVPQNSDEFDQPQLGLQWQWNTNHCDSWASLSARKDWLRLFAQPLATDSIARAPHILSQKFPAPAFTVTTLLQLAPGVEAAKAGLVIVGNAYAGVIVSRAEGVAVLDQVSREDSWSEGADRVEESAVLLDDKVLLRVQVQSGGICTFSYSADGYNFVSIGGPFRAKPGKWIGAKVGLVALGSEGYVDFDYFRFSRTQES